MNENENTNRDFMGQCFGDGKMSKSTELNDSMTISNSGADEYERKIHNMGGNQ